MDSATPHGNRRKPSTRPETAPARFEAKWIGEPNSGCWLWLGSINGNGYSGFHDGERLVGAHHYSWRLNRGTIPKGMYVCHRCDEPTCVNPDHLFIATPSGNQMDRSRKGRAKGGRPEWQHSEELKASIRNDTRSYQEIAEAHGVSFGTVKKLKSAASRGFGKPRIWKLEGEVARLREAIATSDRHLEGGHLEAARATLRAALDAE